ncbi:MAG: hypothetical protein HYV09_02765 [Deltaproteobacteria bacterium]|nr:hypothetical protein [Deltaproteobacteria bacterium]
MELRLPYALAFASLALLVLDGCGPKKRGVRHAPDTEEPSEGKNLDNFDESVATFRAQWPSMPQGAVVVVRFFNPSNNLKLSLVYVDKAAPEFKPKSGNHLVLAEAKGKNSELLSTLSILHKHWQPGQYACGDDTLIGFALSSQWNPTAGETYGSWNKGAGCELELHPAAQPGDLEGSFRGVFVKNDGSGALTIQDGYIYVKSFSSGSM